MCKKRNSTTKPNLNPISFFSSPTILCFQICMVILCGKLSLSHNLPQIVRQSRYPKNESVCKKMLHSKHFSKCIKITTRKLGSFCFGFSFLLVLLFTSSEILFITVFISIVIRSNYMILFEITTTLQSTINANLGKQRFWHCHENGLIKTIQTIPHNLYVSVKLTSLYCGLRIILVYPNPQ